MSYHCHYPFKIISLIRWKLRQLWIERINKLSCHLFFCFFFLLYSFLLCLRSSLLPYLCKCCPIGIRRPSPSAAYVSAVPQHGQRFHEDLQPNLHDAAHWTLVGMSSILGAHVAGIPSKLVGGHQRITG